MMSVESDIDRAVFLSVDDFGIAAKFTPQNSFERDIIGIFDNDFVEVDAGGGVGFALQQPRFLCRTSDVLTATQGDKLRVNSTNYTVQIVQDDGTGMTTLVMEKQ